MSLAELLDQAAARGVRFQLEGDRLRVRAPKGALTGELSAALRQYKDEIIVLLAERGSPGEQIPGAARDGTIPLSLDQQRLWLLDQLQHAPALYHIPAAGWLDGQLNIAALRKALSAIVRRHEVLRTAVIEADGGPFQQITDADLTLEIEDLTRLPDVAGEVERHAVALVREAFDLARAPLIRAGLFKVAAERHALVLSLHHIAADAWSIGILLSELAELYEAETQGRSPELPALTVQFADFALWQRQYVCGHRRERLVAYWRERLAGIPELLEIPCDRRRPALPSYQGAIERFEIDAPATTVIRQFAVERSATLLQVLLAAFAVLLHRYSAQEVIAIGLPVVNRPRAEFEPLIGFFVNTLVIRADFAGAPSFAALVERVKTAGLEAFAHQELPFETLVGELAPSRSLSHNPLFQAMFALQNARLGPSRMGAVNISRIPLDVGVAKFDLYLSMQELADGGLAGEWEYATDLFDAASARRMIEHFRNLLVAAIADAEAPVTRLPLMSPVEEQRVVVEWNRTEAEWPADCSLVDLVVEQALRTPQAVAVVDERRRLSYAELDRRSNQLAHHLLRFGVRREALVGICVERTVDMIVAVLGVLKAGAACVPLDPAYPSDRLAFMVEDAAIGVVVTDSAAFGAVAHTGARRINLDADHAAIESEPAVIARRLQPEQLAYAIYTSGSTGRPKGILIEHRNAVALIAWARTVYSPADLAGVLGATSLCFDLSIFEIFLPLSVGGAVIVTRDALVLPRHPAAGEVTLVNTVPSAIAELVRSGGVPRSVRVVNLAGEPLKADLVDRIYALGHVERVYDLYGPGETTTYSTWAMRERAGRETIGQPIDNTRLYILDEERKPVPVGVIGEIYIGGAGVTRGYLNREELTRQRYMPDPFAAGRMYRTGDLGRFWPDGAVQYLGRIDNQVKIRGFRIELGEIETVLGRHAGVADCIVDARPVDSGDKRLVAYFTGSATPAGLRSYLRQRLPGFMVPPAIIRVEALPMTPNGKIDRKALPSPDPEHLGTSERYVAPATPADAALCRIWAEVTGAPRVGIHDNFFEIGGDSILAIQVVSRARAAGLALTPQLIFQRQTVAELAPAVVAAQPRSTGGDYAELAGAFSLTPLQEWCLTGDPPEPHHFNQWVLLDVLANLEPAVLEAALSAAAAEHDALRLAFRRTPDGWWQQYEPRAQIVGFEVLADAADAASTTARIKAGIDIERGPLLRATLFHQSGKPRQLLLTAHHLVIDAISWRILCADVVLACAHISVGDPVALPPRTTPFKIWAEMLAGRSGTICPVAPKMPAPLPRDSLQPGYGTHADCARLTGELDQDETRRLIETLPQAYRARVDDALLAALAGAVAEWSGVPYCALDVEGHGRDAFPELDISRTVGWFTAMRRIELSVNAAASPAAALKTAKEALRRASRDSAFGIPSAELSFNYLGQLDAAFAAAPGWALANIGLSAAPQRPRSHLIVFSAAIRAGRLRWELEYSKTCHRRATIVALAASFERRVRDIAEHCAQPETGGYTPSDFPAVSLTQAELDELVADGPDGQFHRNIESIEPLSPQQEGVLFHALLAPEPGIYLTQIAFRLDGPLDSDAFRLAWHHVASHHAALRVCLARDRQQNALQVSLRRAAVPFAGLDWREAPDAAAQLAEFLAADRRRGIERSRAPLFRLTLAQLGPQSWVCVWTCDHTILDGWSLAIVLRELAQSYEACRRGATPQLPPPTESFIQTHAVALSGAAEAAVFWRDEIGQPKGPFELPFERGQRGVLAGRASRNRVLSDEATAALTAFARRHRLTLHTLLQAAWALLLARHADREEVLFGGTVSGRSFDVLGIEAAVGLLIRTVPVRVAIPDEAEMVGWLTGIQERQVMREANAQVPLAAIEQMSKAGRGAPLFETLLVFENYPIEDSLRFGIADLTVRDLQVVEWPHYPLTLVAAAEDRLSVTAIFDTARLSEPAADRILDQYEHVLTAFAAAAPDQLLGEISLLSAAERAQVLGAWNATARDYPARMVIDLFEEKVARSPEVTALAFRDETLTYAELNRWSNRLAHLLHAHGVGPDVLVGVQIERSFELVVALYGILKAGGAYIPLDPDYPAARLDFMRRDSGVSLVLDAAQVRALRDGDDAAPPRTVGPDNLAYMIYTSGSTGRPKGALNTHGGLANRLLWMQETFALGPADAVLQKTPCSFDVSVWEFFWPLIAGARLVLAEPGRHFDRDYLVAAVEQNAVTTIHFVPSVLRFFLDAAGLERCASLRLVMASGEALASDLVRRLHQRLGAELHNLYGPTESAIDVAWWPCSRDGDIETVPIGRPIANTQLYILDRGRRPVPPGVAGELHIGGAQVGRGYWNRPELTAQCFVPNPFGRGRLYRTGDQARFRADGAIEYLGRLDDQLKLGGVRIEPGEIEAALREHAAVADARVVVDGSGEDPRLVAYCTPRRAGSPLVRQMLREHLRTRLPEAMVPAAFSILAALPLLPNGKLDRHSLPPPAGSGAVVAPASTQREQEIAEVWKEVLGIDRVGPDDQFFDLGGYSLAMMRVHSRLQERYGPQLRLVDLFAHPTVRRLAGFLEGAPAARANPPPVAGGDCDIAVIGLACRVPGAEDVEAFWQNLAMGRETIRRFAADELIAAGEDPALVEDSRYVPAYGALDDADKFDAAFFDMPPCEAAIVDPQQRVFLELAWQALESAGYDPARIEVPVGVFAGAGMNTYALNHLAGRRDIAADYGPFALMVASDKDYLPTRISYKLNLRGPSVAVQTACSTSLVAIAMACESLRQGDCAMALAGGVTIRFPQTAGYLHEDGMIFSPDGHCRAFDLAAAGIVAGSGAGIVVLKPLTAALADGDHIHAVIKGIAINNDGAAKVGYTAPSVEGQQRVIREVLDRSGIDPEMIGYIEAHGTGTAIGDPIEIAALTGAWRRQTARSGFCAIGSVKTNLGHLDAAAGVIGFIKAVLAVERSQIPPSLHFERPNPSLELESSPFYVNTALRPWPDSDATRRAAVSAFGIGGTNAHAIIEQAPTAAPAGVSRPMHLLALSARTPSALEAAARRLADRLELLPEAALADTGYTLLAGRRHFLYRRAIVCGGREEAIALLRGTEREAVINDQAVGDRREAVFLFAGYGAQYPGMGRGLYEREPSFRDTIDRCTAMLRLYLPGDIRDVMFGSHAAVLRRSEWAQPALFVIEYALAQLLLSWGIRPAAMLGHSVGEYTAACIAGVFRLENALPLIATRGRLIQGTMPGAMLAVALSEEELRPRLGNSIDLVAVTTPSACVVSGSPGDINRFRRRCEDDGLYVRAVDGDCAAHSPAMEPIMEPLRQAVAAAAPSAPSIPYVSNVTADWIGEAAADPQYWARHIRAPVRLSESIARLAREHPNACFVEVGPGRTLTAPLLRHPARNPAQPVLATLRASDETIEDDRFLLTSVGRLWAAGVPFDERALYAGEKRRRIPLPTYPFERERYLVEPAGRPALPAAPKRQPANWLATPSWQRSVAPVLPQDGGLAQRRWLVFADQGGRADRILRRLRERGVEPVIVVTGGEFIKTVGGFVIRPQYRADYDALLARLPEATPDAILHLWSCDEAGGLDEALDRGLYSLLYLAQALQERPAGACRIVVVTRAAHLVTGEEQVAPAAAAVLGPVRVVPQEIEQISCMQIDIADHGPDPSEAILAEVMSAPDETVVAYRNGFRWMRGFAPVPNGTAAAVPLRDGGTYLITGGLGSLGLEFAEALAGSARDLNLLLLSRRIGDDRLTIARRRLEPLGARIYPVRADVADERVLRQAIADCGVSDVAINGAIHAAGIAGGGMIALRTRDAIEREFAAKVHGTAVLYDVLREHPADFLALCSSTSTLTGGVGSVAYTAANAFQDAFAEACVGANRGGPPVISIGWFRWQGLGMAVEVERLHRELTGVPLTDGIPAEQGRRALRHALAYTSLARVAVSSVDLTALERSTRGYQKRPAPERAPTADLHQRPPIATAYEGPRTQTEEAIAAAWRDALGIAEIGIHDHFTSLGGDSLLAIRTIAHLRRDLAVALPVRAMYEMGTVAELARYVDALRWAADGERPADMASAQLETGVL